MATLTAAQQKALAQQTAQKYGLSPETLWGVYGTETGYGTNLGPSSAGAEGPFQFLPSTGVEYGLDPTTIWQFQPSLDAAARYLASLGANGDPQSARTIAALNAYNGNGGGASLTSYATDVLRNGGSGGTTITVGTPSAPSSPTVASSNSSSLPAALSPLNIQSGFWKKLGLTLAILAGAIALVLAGIRGEAHQPAGAHA